MTIHIVGDGPDLPPIQTMYAWLAKDELGQEGLAAFRTESGNWMPMVCSERDRAEKMRPIAESLSSASGKEIQLVEFSGREVLYTVTP